MSACIEKKTFFRLKAAMCDLIERAGGIERAADVCGYSRSAVGRWHCRHADDMMPIVAIMLLETDTEAPLVTRAMASLNGLDCTAYGGTSDHLMTAYVDASAKTAVLNSEVASAMADGVVTPSELTRIDQAASNAAASVEALRGSVATAAGKPLRVVEK
jgi:hypothetical protein